VFERKWIVISVFRAQLKFCPMHWIFQDRHCMVIILAWQGHCGIIVLGVWFTQGYSCSIIKLVARTTRHGDNIGKLMVKTEEVYLEYPYLCPKYGGVYFTWCMSLCDMGYWWTHSNYILLYYSWHSFLLGYTDAFSSKIFKQW